MKKKVAVLLGLVVLLCGMKSLQVEATSSEDGIPKVNFSQRATQWQPNVIDISSYQKASDIDLKNGKSKELKRLLSN